MAEGGVQLTAHTDRRGGGALDGGGFSEYTEVDEVVFKCPFWISALTIEILNFAIGRI